MKKTDLIQEKILAFIISYSREKGISPTVREIGAAVGLKSTSGVHFYLKKLAEKELISQSPQKQRSIVVGGKGSLTQIVPLVGHVAAGSPVLAIENIKEQLALPVDFLYGAKDGEAFMLEIEGDSMKDIGMYNGDTILVHKGFRINNSDIVVASVNNESITVKRYYDEGSIIRLQPENSTMEPIFIKKENIEIVGKVIGLFRKY